ncbi:sporulation protein [Paenibacillus selenitireducens]|uniref:Sporulation protein n=1 Tax=Paenibacillus selenitireducens TaxID=1324314 RepID=A0A1T2X7G0_9BACL|nr:DUF1360 domain-containing protein [Paenibacillus selenitireducens]OPA75755.1 sporulation protein [Paenibacillus selenitireducens]
MNIEFSWLQLIVLSLASFRFTHLLVYDDITAPIRRLFIQLSTQTDDQGQTTTFLEPKGKGIQHFIGQILLCHWCTGIWSALGLTLLIWLAPIAWWLLIILAVAGLAAIIESIVLRL